MVDWPHMLRGLAVNQSTRTLSWFAAPDAAYRVFAFNSASETDPGKAVATATVARTGPGRDLMNSTVSFSLGELFLPAGVTYYLRVQVLTKDGDANTIPGRAPLLWGANSTLSSPVAYTLASGAADPALPKATVTPTAPSDDEAKSVQDAVAALTKDAEERWGGKIDQAGPAIVVALENDVPTVVTLKDLPNGLDPSAITTMAALNKDGTLTPLPTRVDDDGVITVVVSESAILVPLSVQAAFTDIGNLVAHVKTEVESAAAYMIVEGFRDRTFRPGVRVTVHQAVTMFLRATGIPVEWASAMATGTENGFILPGMTPSAQMSRIQASHLIRRALSSFGMDYDLTSAEIDELLAPFTDMAGMSAADRMAMAVCVKIGVFSGTSATLINPNGILNRSQMASLAVRLQNVLFGLS